MYVGTVPEASPIRFADGIRRYSERFLGYSAIFGVIYSEVLYEKASWPIDMAIWALTPSHLYDNKQLSQNNQPTGIPNMIP